MQLALAGHTVVWRGHSVGWTGQTVAVSGVTGHCVMLNGHLVCASGAHSVGWDGAGHWVKTSGQPVG